MGDELLADYQATVSTVHQLTDVRFKLLAFVPTLSGAGVALLRASDVAAADQAVLSLGGLLFTLGIVLYDLRNSQMYNRAIGRAQGLETAIGFPKFDRAGHVVPGETSGLYRSRSDLNESMRRRDRDRLLGAPVFHGPALALVYGGTAGLWIWAFGHAVADGLEKTRPSNWFETAPHAQIVVAVPLAIVGTVTAVKLILRHDPFSAKDYQALNRVWKWLATKKAD